MPSFAAKLAIEARRDADVALIHSQREVLAADKAHRPKRLAHVREDVVAHGRVERPRQRAAKAGRVEGIGRCIEEPAQ